jgi:hypothetical protein
MGVVAGPQPLGCGVLKRPAVSQTAIHNCCLNATFADSPWDPPLQGLQPLLTSITI